MPLALTLKICFPERSPMPYKPRPCNRCQDPFTPTTSNSQFCDSCREARVEEKHQAMIERQTFTCFHCGETRFNDRRGPTPFFCLDKPECRVAARKRRREQGRESSMRLKTEPSHDASKCWRCGKWTSNASKTCNRCKHVLSTTYADLDCYGGVSW